MKHDPKLYEELADIWRHFASWREKIFAGYVTVLAALGVAFSQNTSAPIRVAVFGGAALVSVVFWILDFRNSQLLNACQDAAALLEDQAGGYRALSSLRSDPNSKTWATYGLAIDLLVGAVIAAASAGMVVYIGRSSKDQIGLLTLGLAVVAAALLVSLLQMLRTKQWSKEVARFKQATASPGAGSPAGT
ncbi:MAG: hypothetical protein HYY14_05740 [Candidatus Omnitrophica bacterium]|nr:hypothetical protein [Candidatus Omnitrophota bacterium]